jgi:methionine-gamma-lyase
VKREEKKMDINKKYHFDTNAIHAGNDGENPSYALNPPIFQTSTFVFEDLNHVERVMSFESDDYVYTRGNNPTLRLFENKMTALEEGNGAVAFASGMAAISSVLFSLLRAGDNVIVNRTVYGSTFNVLKKVLPKYSISHKVTDLSKLENLEALIDEKTKVIYFETPCNPNLTIVDIKRVVGIAKKHGVKVVVDNTFASPYFQRPLTFGVDVVIHSATKYICGHGDVIGGVVVSNDMDYIVSLKFEYMCEFGGVMSPFNAWLLLRGLKTLGLRMRQHEANAMEIAKFLEEHPKVTRVMYPGLESFLGYQVAKEQMDGFGGMIIFEVIGGIEEAKKVLNGVKLLQIAVSLGDCESLIEHPASMTHRGYPQEKLEEFGLTENMIRISVGLECVRDIIADLENALALL